MWREFSISFAPRYTNEKFFSRFSFLIWGQNQIKQIKRLATSYFNLSTILRLPADAGQIRLNTDEEVIAQHRIPSGPHSHEQSPKHLSRQA